LNDLDNIARCQAIEDQVESAPHEVCRGYSVTLATLEMASGIDAGAGDGTIASRNPSRTEDPAAARPPSVSRPAITDSSCDALVVLEGIKARFSERRSGCVGVGLERAVAMSEATAREL